MTHTGKRGAYLSGPLKPGKYLVAFVPGCGNNGNWLLQFYKDTGDPAKAKPVTVTAGKTTANIDARLRPGGVIKGMVTSKSGAKLSGICVGLVQQTSDGGSIYVIATRHGAYAFDGLPSGKYAVQFQSGCPNPGNYAPQQWKDKPLGLNPTLIRITPPKIVSNIDAVLAPGAEISGIVTYQTTGKPLSGICVFANGDGNYNGGVVAQVATDASGHYLLSSMSTGPYQVQFGPGCGNNGNYLPANYPGQVRATDGKLTRGIDAVLQPGAAVKGIVTSKASGEPLAGICVEVYNAGNDDQVSTGPDGSYFADQLPTRSYNVAFYGGCGNKSSYAPQFYDNQPNFAGAEPVALTQGSTTSGVDAAMLPGGTVTGQVTSSTGQRLTNVCVVLATPGLLDLAGQFGGQLTQTFHGSYEFANLDPGQYEANFFSCGSGADFATQSFRAQPGYGSGQLISVDPGSITSGISAVLQPAGVISGTVTGAAGKPLSDVCVTATSLRNGSSAQADNYVTERGKYTISGLAAGAYRVEFSACGPGNYANVWYRNKSTQSAATRVIVRAGRTTPGINAAMTRGGSISGHVSAVGHPVANACVFVYDPVHTNHLGNYVVPDLNTGSDQVEFAPCNAGGPNLAAQIRPGLVHVTAGKAVTGVNAALVRGGSVSGAVSGGTPATAQGGICVDIVPTVPGQAGSAGVTGTGGRYLASNLAPGKYQVFFGDPVCPYGPYSLAPQWYQDQQTRATATKVTVTAGQTTPAVDATLANDGQVSGTVTGPAHAALTGICVAAVQPGAATVIAVTRGGSYSIIDLTPGRYRVEFTSGCGASGYANQWWKDAGSAAKATVITVPASTVTTGIDAVLKH